MIPPVASAFIEQHGAWNKLGRTSRLLRTLYAVLPWHGSCFHRYSAGLLVAATVLCANNNPGIAQTQVTNSIEPYREQREAYVDAFRVSGTADPKQLIPLKQKLLQLIATSKGKDQVEALLELGTVQRIAGDFASAVKTLTQAADTAERAGAANTVFEAWLGVARAYSYGTSDYGAAATAFERAVDAVAETATKTQLSELAGYSAELKIKRGDAESGIVEALQALALTADPTTRFYIEMDIGDGLERLVESCDYGPLTDSKSADDPSDAYAACRRAVVAGIGIYGRAAETATTLGWAHLANQMHDFQNDLQMRRQLVLEPRAAFFGPNLAAKFHPRTIQGVTATGFEQFKSVKVTDDKNWANLIDELLRQQRAHNIQPDARSKFLEGLAAEIRGDQPDDIAEFLGAAAILLGNERAAFVDPRRRGTAIEDRARIISNLSLRLLALGRQKEAFSGLESLRARGLAELSNVLSQPDLTATDRRWLANLLLLEARASAMEHGAVADLIASGRIPADLEKLSELESIRKARQALLRSNNLARSRFLSNTVISAASLDELSTAAARTGIPVLLFVPTETSLIAWYVGADGSEVRNVFLPSAFLTEKVSRVTTSANASGTAPYDEATARELFLFLLGPFLEHLSSSSAKQIFIVPQGTLASLPFEALVDPATGSFASERWIFSYAPSATLALKMLRSVGHQIRTVEAWVNPTIDDVTKELASIRSSGAVVQLVSRDQLFDDSNADGLHILTHGRFDESEALLSTLDPTSRQMDPALFAAELLALPPGIHLAVLSACDGGRVASRISGEIYGFSWALLASGVESAVLSRWRVDGDSNGLWMKLFYRELAKGVSPAVAASRAMREMRNTGYVHPYYWAAMQVSGR
jgi:CHAT domain-containing protein